MISYGEALSLIRATAAEAGCQHDEAVPLLVACGRVCSSPIVSGELMPPFSNSAMDGFAVQASAVKGASRERPLRVAVKGMIAAGDTPVACIDRTVAWEIMTGAPMPVGFDAVVRIEDVRVERDAHGAALFVELLQPLLAKENVRDAGEDFNVGSPVVQPAMVIQPEHILALASLGVDQVRVFKKPRVAVVSTGRELVSHSAGKLAPGQIRNSTAPFLLSALAGLGADVEFCGTIADEPREFIRTMERLIASAPDIIITTGAVSMGKYDFVPTALGDLGAEVLFHKVSIRPGKPILFAKFKGRTRMPVVFGVPGNAVSTVVGLRFFVEPYLRALVGMAEEHPLRARLAYDVKKPEGLRCFFKARLEIDERSGAMVKVLPGQASFMVRPLLESTAWAVLPEAGRVLRQGEWIDVVPLYPLSYDWSADGQAKSVVSPQKGTGCCL
jgi:molybdopterin molybdotransferase